MQGGKASDDRSRERQLKDQGTVLLHILNQHPHESSVWTVVSELVGMQNRHTREWDRYEQAAWRLVSAGLLLAGYERIKPSRQALRFNEILNASGIPLTGSAEAGKCAHLSKVAQCSGCPGIDMRR